MAPVVNVNTNATILVTREKQNFKISLLSGKKEAILNASKLQGSAYKYPHEFITAFVIAIGVNVNDVLLSAEANDYMMELLAFNRIDN